MDGRKTSFLLEWPFFSGATLVSRRVLPPSIEAADVSPTLRVFVCVFVDPNIRGGLVGEPLFSLPAPKEKDPLKNQKWVFGGVKKPLQPCSFGIKEKISRAQTHQFYEIHEIPSCTRLQKRRPVRPPEITILQMIWATEKNLWVFQGLRGSCSFFMGGFKHQPKRGLKWWLSICCGAKKLPFVLRRVFFT